LDANVQTVNVPKLTTPTIPQNQWHDLCSCKTHASYTLLRPQSFTCSNEQDSKPVTDTDSDPVH